MLRVPDYDRFEFMQPKWGQDVESIEEILINQLSEKFGAKPELTDSLIFLGIDSVGMAELTFDIEQRFKISVDDTLLNVETVQDLADYIRERLKP